MNLFIQNKIEIFFKLKKLILHFLNFPNIANIFFN
jgi:hypothetical protein